MKVAAHPLVVAVALGMLGPGALEATLDDREDRDDCRTCSTEGEVVVAGESMVIPSAEEFQAVEIAWLKSTATTG